MKFTDEIKRGTIEIVAMKQKETQSTCVFKLMENFPGDC
uniref:Peroxiredoxin n=1 Tax=Papaver somniferum TaxID=3469 RepID=A0A5B7LK53_PAPSO|nr:peroxiredoxin [Papaver somniferum]